MTGQISPDGPNIATASADKSVKLWSLNPELEFQKSVSLNIERKKELLVQEGHSGAIYSLAFQQDGSLLASGDLHGVGLIWDLRSGKNILQFPAHKKSIIAMQFLPNGF